MSDSSYLDINRAGWDQRARVHFTSDFYDVPGFLAGNTSLKEIELAGLGDVSGKTLLHLQCHFGLDTLSWTRLGATCTGVDLSPVAIDQANDLARQTGLNARFVCSDLYSYRREQAETFDIVFTSYGTVCWLPDLTRWAKVIADNLAPGGTFYMAEFHPIYDLLEGYSYFTLDEPDIEEGGTYTENGEALKATFANWSHPLSSVINALIGAGIQIEKLDEYRFSPYNCFANMEEREPGRYYLTHRDQVVPIVYSLKGKRVVA